jgi:PDZ domain-containing secreted protein
MQQKQREMEENGRKKSCATAGAGLLQIDGTVGSSGWAKIFG